MTLHVYEIDAGETYFYVAETADEALQMFLAEGNEVDIADPVTVSQIPDDRPLIIDVDGDKQQTPARKWATAKGCIGSTCY